MPGFKDLFNFGYRSTVVTEVDLDLGKKVREEKADAADEARRKQEEEDHLRVIAAEQRRKLEEKYSLLFGGGGVGGGTGQRDNTAELGSFVKSTVVGRRVVGAVNPKSQPVSPPENSGAIIGEERTGATKPTFLGRFFKRKPKPFETTQVVLSENKTIINKLPKKTK